MKEHVFNMKDPIIVGMEVVEGNLRVGTPLCIPALGGMEIGRVTSIEQVKIIYVGTANRDSSRGCQFCSTLLLLLLLPVKGVGGLVDYSTGRASSLV